MHPVRNSLESRKMNKILLVLLTLAAYGCGNEHSANLVNSTAVQINNGAGNKQSINAVGSTAVASQSGFANQQSMNLHNASGTQTQSGIGNRQSMNLVDGQSATQNQVGSRNTQTLEIPCKKAKVKNVTMNQFGFFNNQTATIGGPCDEASQSEKSDSQLSAANGSINK